MVALTKDQKQIRKRIKESIDREISMCDDYADLIVLATALYASSKQIVEVYADKFGEEAAEKAIKKTKG